MSKKFTGEITNTNELKHVAGHNYFKLSTDGATIEGVLTEMPSFGLNAKWENAPIGDLGSKIEEFFMGDLIKATSFLFGAGGYKNQVAIDKWTQRMFVGTENQEIHLKWRVYGQNTLNQTDAKTVISHLAKYATIDSSAVLSMGTLTNNITAMLSAVKDETGAQAAELVSLIYGADTTKDDEAKKAWLKKANPWFNTHKEELLQKVKDRYKGDGHPDLYLGISGTKENKEKRRKDILRAIDELKIVFKEFKIDDENILKDKNYRLDQVEFARPQYSGIFGSRTPSAENEWTSQTIFDLSSLKLDADNILRGFSESGTWEDGGALEQDVVTRLIKDYVNLVNVEMGKYVNEPRDAQADAFKNAYDTAENMINGLGSEFIGEGRVGNKSLGSSLWKLELYNFIFKKPLIVMVTSWTATPSKEMFGTSHVYYEFDVAVKLDQINSGQTWHGIFGN